MNRRYAAMWQRAFEAKFLAYREQGLSEDRAIELAEHDADIGLDRYCDDKLEEQKFARHQNASDNR